jgi:VIT1/CCC1 family predicted Fe2+/Mn2+ transporter
MMASLILSTIAFFAASYFIKRWMDDNDIPKGMTRSITIFAVALGISYGVGWLVEHLA